MEFMDKPHEECGVFGVACRQRGERDVVAMTYHALYALQHRGQESCGIVVNDDGVMRLHRDLGLVGEVFTPEALASLPRGEMAIGHCRYATTGMQHRSNAQPLLINHRKGSTALCHNGNLTNAAELREELEARGAIFHSTSDTEVIAYVITQQRMTCASIEDAVLAAARRLRGAYSLLVMSPTKLIALRDPHGFKPLCMGRIGEDVVFASESCALSALGATLEREVRPGEMVVVGPEGVRSLRMEDAPGDGLCVFEYIYFARPDSVMEGASVHEARLRAGEFLAKAHPVEADVVIGVPDSGLDAALGYSRASGIPYGIGFIKNKYIGRTFIQPEQKQRQDAVRIKLSAVPATVAGKRVVMVDDSIVRGTTSARIVRLLRDAGAREVHVRLSSPPFTHPCYFGTDVDSTEHLIAASHSVEEIGRMIGADSIGFLPFDALDKLAPESACGFCKGCFCGDYPEEPPRVQMKLKFEQPLHGERE